MSLAIYTPTNSHKFAKVQSLLQVKPGDCQLLQLEKRAKDHLGSCILAEEGMIKQKSKDRHLNLGECNSKYFYSHIRARIPSVVLIQSQIKLRMCLFTIL